MTSYKKPNPIRLLIFCYFCDNLLHKIRILHKISRPIILSVLVNMTINSIIRDLNEILKIQLTAINQFFVHSKIQKKNGWPTIAMRYARFAIQGGKTADKLLEILVDLNELPQIKDYDLLRSHREIKKQLTLDAALTLSMITCLHKCIKKCQSNAEPEIEAQLKEILQEAEKQIDFLESQLHILDSVGLEVYTEGLKISAPQSK